MLANHIGVHMMWIDIAVLGKQAAETGRVERCSRSEYATGRHAAARCKLRRQVRHHVHWVGRHDKDGIRCMPQDGGDNLAKNGCVALEKLQPRFARLLPDARTKHNHSAANQCIVIASVDFKRMSEWHGVSNVIGLSDRAIHVLVDEHNLAADPLHHERVARSGSDKSASDNSNFHGVLLDVDDFWFLIGVHSFETFFSSGR